jgi:hypothetical protein
VLEGDLTDFSIPEVLRLLSLTAKTGRLQLQDTVRGVGDAGTARHGRIDLVDGRIRDASADADRLVLARRVLGTGFVTGQQVADALAEEATLPTDLRFASRLADADVVDVATLADLLREQTIDALFDLLRWDDGSFRFASTVGEEPGPAALELALTVDEALDETAHRLEAWPSLVERTGAADAVVAIRQPGPDRAELALTPDAWAFLALVDGQRTIDELTELGGQGAYRTRRDLVGLVEADVVTVEGADTSRVAALLRDHTTLAHYEARLTGRPVTSAAAAPVEPTSPEPSARPEQPTPPGPSTPSEPATLPEPSTPPAAPEPVRRADPPTRRDDRRTPVYDPRRTTPRPGPARATSAATSPAAPSAPVVSPARAEVRALRSGPRGDRLRTDPIVDEELVTQLIAGIEAL